MIRLPCGLLVHFVHDRGCNRHPAFPAPFFEEGVKLTQTSGGSRREIAKLRSGNDTVCNLNSEQLIAHARAAPSTVIIRQRVARMRAR